MLADEVDEKFFFHIQYLLSPSGFFFRPREGQGGRLKKCKRVLEFERIKAFGDTGLYTCTWEDHKSRGEWFRYVGIVIFFFL